MSADPALSLRVSEIRDSAALFERYNTDEIRRIERKVRAEIEQKKEELRQMVGERYRDLIDAADTIGEMRQCSESVLLSVQDMHRYCLRLKHAGTDVISGRQESQLRQQQEQFYLLASEIQLLLELPERMWSAMEASRFLQATQLYLLSAHLHAHLQLDSAAATSAARCSPVLARFPILVRQVATTGHFRSAILQDSRSLLRGRVVSDQAVAEALVSTLLLEDGSPRQALNHFLLARKASVHLLLNQPQHGAGIKAQVCSLVELLVTTVFQAYAVFYLPPEGSNPRPADGGLSCGLLFSILDNVTCSAPAAKVWKVLQEEASTSGWFRFLPPSVTEFQPRLRSLAQPIQTQQLREALQHWIHTCKEDISEGVGGLLVYVRTLRGLASIRDAVWDLLCSESISLHWSSVCQQLLERPLALWEDFLQELFLRRLQVITQEETEAISTCSVQLLSSSLRDLETQRHPGPGSGRRAQFEADVASFLWSESPGDLPSDAGWVSVAQRGQQQQQRSGLALKTRALTPCVQNFCSSLDSKLKTRLDDLQHYLPPQDAGSGPAPESSAPFNRFLDSAAVEESLRQGSLACVRHILSSVRSELAAASPDPPGSDPRGPPPPGPARLSSVLFMARLCQSLGELCPNLRLCVLGRQSGAAEAPGAKGPKGAPRPGAKKLGRAQSAAEVDPAQAKWAELKEELLNTSMEAYRIWSAAVSKELLGKFGAALCAQSAGAVLSTATNWEELEIQEEAESGSSVTSKIRLPAQPSWLVQSLLFQLCVEVNRVGGHALPRPTLQELLLTCLSQVMGHYHSLSQQGAAQEGAFPMTQNRALQLLFDLRYLNSTLGPRSEDGKSGRAQRDHRFSEVCDWLESFIDPFDLDVFTPPLNANLSRLSQRTSVLLGLLTGAEKMFTSRSSSSANAQEPFNILPLASSQIRFGLLPLSMSNAQKSKMAARTPEAPLQLAPPPSSALTNEDSLRPGSLFRQMAAAATEQDEDSTPSLFKLSWLSGK